MHFLASVLFYGAIIITILFLISFSDADTRKSFMSDKFTLLIVFVFLFGAIGITHHFKVKTANNNVRQEAADTYEQLGHRIRKSNVKEEKDGFYYTDKADSKIRYFTNDDDKITAIKYNYMPNPMEPTAVKSELANLLNDDHLKYGNEKLSGDKTLLKGDDYNIYSPKSKKWYHMSMQKDDSCKVSTFSVWEGKSSDAE